MNILPLVSAFILIFAIGSYTFVHNYLCSIQEQTHFTGAMQVSHAYSRKSQSKAYRKIKGENLHPSQKSEGEKKGTEYKSPRKRFYPYNEAKLNVRSLLNEESPKLEKIFLSFISELYASSPLKNEEIGPLMLKLLKKAKALNSIEELIHFASEEDRELVYHVLKGTQNYEINTAEGYPALGDFVHIGKDKEPPIHFCHASYHLLKVIFGHPTANDICEKEKEKWLPEHKHLPLDKEELTQLVLNNRGNLVNVEELLDYKKSKDALDEEVIEQAGIKIRHKF